MNQSPDCQLTLAVPERLTEELIDFLVDQTDLVDGLSLHAAEGMGSGTALLAPIEKVRGRARRTLLVILIDQAQAATLIERLRAQLPMREIAWWTTPVNAFGRLA